MMQVDLSRTRLTNAASLTRPPNEAEILALTVALLLPNDAAYSELAGFGLELTHETVRDVAEGIEYRTPAFARDFGAGEELRERLSELVGLRINGVSQERKPTEAYLSIQVMHGRRP